MITVDRLTKVYGDKTAVSDVSFEMKAGEILGFLGPNGAGKTTTMRILAGYMPATSGSASIDGHDVFSDSLAARRAVGYLPENVPLYAEMSVRSYLDYMATLKGVPGKSRRARVADAAERSRVTHVLDSKIGKLSKGYRQRVGLAQALVHDPKVLILDEPTVGLDPKQITETRSLIKSLGGDHTIILSTHILPEVSMTCGRVIVINEGRLIAQDSVENLTRRSAGHQSVQIEVRGPADEARRRFQKVAGVQHVQAQVGAIGARFVVESAADKDLREELARVVVQAGWGLLELSQLKTSLEDVFLKLISREPETEETSESPDVQPTRRSPKNLKKGGITA
jgi:ABC-2 type transport system ATP-binding protein